MKIYFAEIGFVQSASKPIRFLKLYKFNPRRFPRRTNAQKLLPLSRIQLVATIFLLFFTLNGRAQNTTPLLDRNVSLDFTGVPLQEALFLLSEKADFNLSFNSGILPPGRLISFKCEKKKLSEIFPYLLPAEIDIKTSGNNVILLKKPARKRKKKELTVRGKIIDAGSGQPINDVTVLDVYGSQSTLTDTTGDFKLRLTHKRQDLVLSISKTGYQDSSALLIPESQDVLFLLHNTARRKEIQLNKIERIPIKPVEASSLSKLVVPELLVTHTENIKGYTKRKFQLSLTPGTSTNLKIAGTIKNEISINLIGGYNYGVGVLELGGAFNINRADVSGLQVAGVTNLVGGEMNGLQMAGAINVTKGKQGGLQIAGALNIAGSLSGVQLSPAYNESKYLAGLQLSSGLNVCDTMKGVQIGIVNRAKQQNGFQLGIVNINDSSEGLSIGLLNFVKGKKFPRIGFAYKK